MKEFSKNKKNGLTREAIIGLGEDSFRKNYYPELQDRLLELEKTNGRNRALIETIPDILLVSDYEGRISPIGKMREQHKDAIMSILRDKSLIGHFRELIKKLKTVNTLITYDFQIGINQQQHFFEARLQGTAFDEVLIMIRDMTERVTLENTLRDMVDRDSLSQVYNRHYFESLLAKKNHISIQDFSLIIIDIDGLKMINDTLGHRVGDRMIKEVSRFVRETFDNYGVVARIGGDEFGVILEKVDIEEIESLLVRLNQRIKNYNQQENTIRLSLSSGYAYHAEGHLNVELIFQEADNNMYQNKLLKTSSTKNNLVKTLMKALEAKDYITEGHADRMEVLATVMGRELKLQQNIIDRIQLLTKFHDIGKVGIPDSILKKAGSLTEDEWRVMRTHSSIGERIANESSELKEIAHLILKHHERYDGNGYPLGLKGEDIPIECRILSIVDTFDAMTNDRPYRKALPVNVAIEEIIAHAGTQFDPELVEIFRLFC